MNTFENSQLRLQTHVKKKIQLTCPNDLIYDAKLVEYLENHSYSSSESSSLTSGGSTEPNSQRRVLVLFMRSQRQARRQRLLRSRAEWRTCTVVHRDLFSVVALLKKNYHTYLLKFYAYTYCKVKLPYIKNKSYYLLLQLTICIIN